GVINYGADGEQGETLALSLTLNSDGESAPASGLYALDADSTGQGEPILLRTNESGDIEGYTESGGTYFTLSVDGNDVVFTQQQAIWHADAEESLSLAAGVVELAFTGTDGDGDTVSGTLDVGSAVTITITDDVPTFNEEGIEDASLSTAVGSEATGSLNLEIGADLEGAQISGATLKQDDDGYIQVQYEEGGVTQSAFLTSGGSKLQYEFDQDSQQLIAFKQGDSSSNPVFTIDFDVANGSYEINVIEALDPVTVGFENAGVTSNGGGTGLALELDGADLNAVFTMQDGGNVNWSNTGIGGSPNNLIGNGDVLVANFDQVLTELSFTASRGVGNPQTAEWKVYLDGQEVGSGTGNNITGIEGGFDEVHFIGHGKPNDQYRVNDFSGRYQDSSIDYQLPVEVEAVDGDGDTVDSGFTIGFDPESLSIELPEPEEPAAPSITGGEVLINEAWLPGGTREGQGDTTQEGSIQLSAEGGIASLSVGGETLDFAALQDLGNSPVSIQIDGIGTLSLTGFQGTDTGGTLSYELTLDDNVNHDDVQGRNNAEFDIDLAIVDLNSKSDSGTLELVVKDDVPEGESDTIAFDVVINEFGIDDINGNWSNANGSSSANVPNGIGIIWGGNNFNQASGYKFEYANNIDAEESVVSGDPVSLGTFTHVNNSVPSGSAINAATLSLNVDVVLNGTTYSIPVEVQIDHNETPNNYGDSRDDDIITIESFSITDPSIAEALAAAGYEFTISGFRYEDGGSVGNQVRTPEGQSTSFELLASIDYVGEPATAEGSISADWGADGPAENDPIIVAHENGNSEGLDSSGQAVIEGEYGILTLTDDGNGEYSYAYVLSQAGRQALKTEGNLTENFSYTLKDGDGDEVNRDITLNLTGVTPPIELVDMVDQAFVNTVTDESTENYGSISASVVAFSYSDSSSMKKDFEVNEDSSGHFSFTTNLSDSSSNSSFSWSLSRWTGTEFEVYQNGASEELGTSLIEVSNLAPGDYRFEANVNVSRVPFGASREASVSNVKLVQTTESLDTREADDNLFNDASVFLGNDDIELTILGAGQDGNDVSVDVANTVIAGRYGELTISPDGTYSYQPEESTEHVGGVERFEYQVTNPDTGQNATATLSIQIDSDDFNVIFGTEVDETLEGSGGLDILVGGAGDDTLTGGDGDDVFRWNFGDEGTVGQPADDTVTDFGTGNDKLDLSDLLQGEDSDNINGYIFAEEDGDNVVLSISTEGNLNGSTSVADQKITLEGKSFSDFGVNSGASEDLIAKLIEDGQLKIDQ
ncbi:type I secretion C-terminal target domain (VC_A0849 subclass), partial [Vreelandella subterranea]